METPLISIIVPIYNVEKYLDRCLKSILCQSYTSLQIILVDDGSIDNSGLICDEYAFKDDRVEVIHKTNGGLVSARKTGLEYAIGDFVGFVDGDDYIEKGMYEQLCRRIIDSKADFIHSGFVKDSDTEKEYVLCEVFDFEVKNYDDRKTLLKSCLLLPDQGKAISASIWSKLFRRRFIQRVYSYVPDNHSYGEDVIALYVALSLCKKITVIREAYYHQVIHSDSMSSVKGDRYLKNEISLASALFDVNAIIDSNRRIGSFDQWIRRRILSIVATTSGSSLVNSIPQYYFRNENVLKGKKIILYGAGVVGKDYLYQIGNNNTVDIVAIADRDFKNVKLGLYEIIDPNRIVNLSFDYIVIAVFSQNSAENIKNQLVEMGISESRILWEDPFV